MFTKIENSRYRKYIVVPDLSRNVFFFVIVKFVYSLVLVQAVIRAYRKNLKIRGGRSPFRAQSNSSRNRDVENPSGSPKLKLSSSFKQKQVFIC